MLTFKLNKKCKAIFLMLFVGVLLSFSFGNVLAKSSREKNIVVEPGQTLENTSFFSGNNIRIDGDINATTILTGGNIEVNGTIDGDLFVAGQNVTINGTVKGSLFIASQNITVNGVIENSIYLAGNLLKVNVQMDGSAFLAGENVYVEEGATIGKDVFVGATNVYLDGAVSGNFFTSNGSLYVSGKVDGDLTYFSKNKAAFSNDSDVVGETIWKKSESRSSQQMITIPLWAKIIFSILSSLVIWFFIKLIRPNLWMNLAENISTAPLKAFGTGLVAILLIPIVSLLLLMTIIGAPLSMILISLYSMSLYVSKIILSVFMGQWIGTRLSWNYIQGFWLFLLSLILLSVVGMIPFVGWIFSFIIVSIGLGSIVLALKSKQLM